MAEWKLAAATVLLAIVGVCLLEAIYQGFGPTWAMASAGVGHAGGWPMPALLSPLGLLLLGGLIALDRAHS